MLAEPYYSKQGAFRYGLQWSPEPSMSLRKLDELSEAFG